MVGFDGGMGVEFIVLGVISAVMSIGVTIGIIVLIVLGIRWLIRQDRAASYPRPNDAPRPEDALEVLKARYARGEIDDDEYERRRKTLLGS